MTEIKNITNFSSFLSLVLCKIGCSHNRNEVVGKPEVAYPIHFRFLSQTPETSCHYVFKRTASKSVGFYVLEKHLLYLYYTRSVHEIFRNYLTGGRYSRL